MLYEVITRWLEISDFSNETLLAVIDRLEQSDQPRHWILREAELDDLWRYIEAAMDNERRVDPPRDKGAVAHKSDKRAAVKPATHITVEGARQHNLRDVSVRIPRDAMTVLCGPSGSGIV